MAVQAHCAKCRESQMVVIDVKLKTVHCDVCDEPIVINRFLADRLKELNQVRKTKSKGGNTFDLKCDKCGVKVMPMIIETKFLGKMEEELACPTCKSPFTSVSPVFQRVLLPQVKQKIRENALDAERDAFYKKAKEPFKRT